jgi:hypothetical protein
VHALQGLGRFYAFQVRSACGLFAAYEWPRVARVVGRSFVRIVRWTAHVHWGRPATAASNAKCTVVLVSYKRPANMDMQVRSALKCAFVESVIVCNNNPDVTIGDWVKVHDPRLRLLDRPRRTGPGIRIALAAESEAEFIISFDDDAFHTQKQLATLFGALVAEPEIVHGTEGEAKVPDMNTSSSESDYPFECGRRGMRCEVDALTQGYAFTRKHARRCLELFELLGLPKPEDIFNGEDLALSRSGEGNPRLEDIGEFAECLSSFSEDTALNRTPGFFPTRIAIHQKLASLGYGHAVADAGGHAPPNATGMTQ